MRLFDAFDAFDARDGCSAGSLDQHDTVRYLLFADGGDNNAEGR